MRTAEERVRAIAGRADALAAAAAAERQARERAAARLARRRRARGHRPRRGRRRRSGHRPDRAVHRAGAGRAAGGRAGDRGLRAGADQRCGPGPRRLSAELDALVDQAHSAEIVAAEHRMRLEQISGRAAEEFGINAGALVAEYGPGFRCRARRRGPAARAGFDRAEQERRAQQAERQLAQLGKVNPLALEEFDRPAGAARVPRHPARRPQEDQARPAHRGQGGGRPGPAGLRVRLRGHRTRVRGHLLPAVPRRRRASWC